MKQATLSLLILLTFSAFGQNYPFAKNFVNGVIFFKDFTQKTGQLKWEPQQNKKLQFRENEDGKTTKYSPEEIAGFTVDTLKFVSLYNFNVYAEEYPLLGKTSNIKYTFAQLIDTGKFNVYFVLITGYDGMSGSLQTYPNFLFEGTSNNDTGLVAYPFLIRMREKKYDKAKEKLYALFKDYPEIIEKLKNYKQQDDFFEIINMVKAVNRQ